ncbi:MAG: hypothetical protein BWK76_17940 [Desulfobulbaceae bacterium A2]|nr:MAG: hypothetical protein BWK76_17940 [Desulfobulbaceae bacterium A2]
MLKLRDKEDKARDKVQPKNVYAPAMETWEIGRHSPEQAFECLLRWAAPGEGVVCFDYFDTLVVRQVAPEHTKRIAAALLNQLLHVGPSCAELYGRRQQLELQLCRQRADQGGEPEFDLAELARLWYEELQRSYPESLSRWDAEGFVRMILDVELAVEQNVQYPCRPVVDLARRLKQAGYTLVLASDFYLPGEFFRRMVTARGLDDLFTQIYVSIDHGAAKGSGRLYDKISADMGLPLSKLFMLGDNPHADIAMATARGLPALRVDNPAQRRLYEKWSATSLASPPAAVFDKRLPESGPFAEMGVSLWLFTWRLLRELLRNQVQDVVFFSKEGELLRQLFDNMQDHVLGHRPVHSHYLLVSRKATFLGSLRPLAHEDFHRIFNHYRDISLRDFLLSLNLEEGWCRGLCVELGLDFDTRHHNLPGHEAFRSLLASPAFAHAYEEGRRRQRHNLQLYIESLALDHRRRGLTIVDVGWKGSIQDNLYWSFDGEVAVQGYYLGSLIATETALNNRKQGLLFDDRPVPSPYFEVYNNNRSLFEMMLGASHGSADGYYTEAQWTELTPDPHRKVQRRVETPAGPLLVAVRDQPEERRLYEQWIVPLQQGYLRTAAALNQRIVLAKGYPPLDEWFARCHARMVFSPSRVEVDLFSRLYHLENFGVFEFTDFRVHEAIGLRRRLGHLRAVRRQPELLESGIWPPIILNRLGIGWYRHVDGRLRLRRAFSRRER